jgi:hypothetical protein
MSELIKGREFQIWEYHVSHGSLLIRSPAGQQFDTSIDLIFVGVEYVAAPRHLGLIMLTKTSESEISRLSEILHKELAPERVWALQSSHKRFFVVAAALRIEEYRGNIFDSPFAR